MDKTNRWYDPKFVEHTMKGLPCYPVYMQVLHRTSIIIHYIQTSYVMYCNTVTTSESVYDVLTH
jgi:hypothetical protein